MTSDEINKHGRRWGVRTDVRDGTNYHSTESERENYIAAQNSNAPFRVAALITRDAALHNLALDFMRRADTLDAAARDTWFEMNERGIRECCDWPIAVAHVLSTREQIESLAEARAAGERRQRERERRQ
ncbi:hypothetical protein [Paraburkholderia susongensis]|nr:hypothetical protein [Paraburkholderia susongensis]